MTKVFHRSQTKFFLLKYKPENISRYFRMIFGNGQVESRTVSCTLFLKQNERIYKNIWLQYWGLNRNILKISEFIPCIVYIPLRNVSKLTVSKLTLILKYMNKFEHLLNLNLINLNAY